MSFKLLLQLTVLLVAANAAWARQQPKASHALGKHVRSKAGAVSLAQPRFLEQPVAVTQGPLSPPPVQGAALAVPAPQPAAATPPEIAGAQPTPPPPPVNLKDIAAVQNQVAEKLKEADALGSKLEEAVNELSRTTGANERKGVEYTSTVVNPPQLVKAESPEAAAESALEGVEAEAASKFTALKKAEEDKLTSMCVEAPPLYTAPVIVLLPPDTTAMDKLEFARAIACRGKMNTAEMRAIRTAKLSEMASIKGTTIEQLEEEVKDTEKKLEETKASRHKIQEELRQVTSNAAAGAAVKADIVFLRDDLKLEDEKIKVLLDKLQTMQDRLEKLRKQEEKAAATYGGKKRSKGRKGRKTAEEEE